jgi:hypothetical protein
MVQELELLVSYMNSLSKNSALCMSANQLYDNEVHMKMKSLVGTNLLPLDSVFNLATNSEISVKTS